MPRDGSCLEAERACTGTATSTGQGLPQKYSCLIVAAHDKRLQRANVAILAVILERFGAREPGATIASYGALARAAQMPQRTAARAIDRPLSSS
jgi:hypothetical protein